MSVEAWRAMAERFGVRYGVEVYIGGSRAYATRDQIFLPSDVPERMQDALHGMFLHVKEHILQKDADLQDKQSLAMRMALELVQDIHNDELIMHSDPGAEGLYQCVHEYQEQKFPIPERHKLLAWQQKAAMELHNRSLPRSVWEGESFGADRQVKHFFKKNRKEIKQLYRELKGFAPNKKSQDQWARWLLDRLFVGIPTDDEIIELIKKMMGAGLIPPQLQQDSFECISPGDLKQKVPEAVTVQKLKEFLTETFDETHRDDSGTIDPSKLPTYWNGDDDLFADETLKKVKAVKIKLCLDSSGSMDAELEDRNKRYTAVIRGVGLVAQAVERIVTDEGMDISLEAWAFSSTDRLLKRPEERWAPAEFKKKYMSNFGGGTAVAGLIRNIAAENTDAQVKTIVVVLTDGDFGDNGNEEIEKAMTDKNKKWLLVGIGDEVQEGGPFRFVAKTLDDVEYILCQVVKEAAAQL
jgi:hypothetical protein